MPPRESWSVRRFPNLSQSFAQLGYRHLTTLPTPAIIDATLSLLHMSAEIYILMAVLFVVSVNENKSQDYRP